MDVVFTLVQNGLLAASISLLVGLGFFLVFSTRGFFDLSFGVLIPVGGYSVLALTRWLQAPLWLGVSGALIATALLAYAIDTGVFQPFRAKRAGALTLLVVSLGVMTVLQSVLGMLFSSRYQLLPSFAEGVRLIQFGTLFQISPVQLAIIGFAVALICALSCLLRFSAFGKALRAIRDDRQVAETIGIHTRRITTVAVLIAGALAGLCGVLIGMDVGIEPTSGFGFLLKGVTAALLGGVESIRGVVVGALVLGAVEQASVWLFPGAWKEAIVFMVLFIVLKVRASRGLTTT